MDVAVGSTNPVKLEAVEGAIRRDATIAAVSVDSGVSEQPIGHEETARGARIRARNAFTAGKYDLAIGIEGEEDHLGCGPGIPLPDAIADRIDEGGELGPILDDILGTEEIAKGEGAAGVFTRGRIDRAEALETVVAGSIAPFVCSLYG